jgi:hypothetical protein
MLNMKLPAAVKLNIIAPAGGLAVGVPALVGGMVVIPEATAAAGALVAVQAVGGAFRVPKVAATAFATVGAQVDWDPTPGEVVVAGSTTGNFPVGFVVEAALAADTHVVISLMPGEVTAY